MARPVVLEPSLWAGLPVFLTGHTGFKGSWLGFWLSHWGARVHGYALDPVTEPSLYEALQLRQSLVADTRGDLGDLAGLQAAMQVAEPQVVFHLAAQSLVRQSYREPVGTVATNVLGTAHVLEAVRHCPSVRAVIVVTTDKVYENLEWSHPYRESDRLGGHDLYSASKAAAELISAAYRSSFLANRDQPVRVCTVRAGNVIGGGDWSADRLVPDCMRAFARGMPVSLRHPHAVRPWQHVLDPLAGYLQLAQRLLFEEAAGLPHAMNFGPDATGDEEVGLVAQALARHWGVGAQIECVPQVDVRLHEAGLLRLDPSLARASLGWQCRWHLDRALERTVWWYRKHGDGADAQGLCRTQIDEYVRGVGATA